MRRLDGKTALVTGASRGIGRAIAERLGRDGAAIALHHLDEPRQAAEIADAINGAGGKAVALTADLRRTGDIEALFDAAERALGRVDIVVANAGVNMSRPVADTSEADFEFIFGVNARGTFFTLREAARRVPEGGRIVALSSNMVVEGRPGVALYAASKAAVEQFVRILAKELGPRAVTVNAVAPGPTDTQMVSQLSRDTAPAVTPLGRLGQPRDIADVIAFLATEDAGWITGQVIGVNGGLV